ncbi:UTRA domain-containing protein [Streptomyces sp. SID4917]|uniref:UTRA domain-containing protein n=1 Tax=Streptomyces sp. MnatMP-M17 TaxID=1839780 RepID=UPI00081E93F3|nr:UTRA domain-containing protein [Streptomyces sp. SID4917]SCF63196.1 UTRA domain-containing protein [Streptomyces sp. MnatMP-M17]
MVYANTRFGEAEQRAVPDAVVSVRCDTRTVEADGQLSLLLGVDVGSPVAEYVFIGHQGTSPRSLARIYVPHAVARLGVPRANESVWGDGVRESLSAAGVGVARTTERVTARFPTTAEAQTLHITTRSPVLAVERVSTDATERVVEEALPVLPGDRTEILFTTGSVPERLERSRWTSMNKMDGHEYAATPLPVLPPPAAPRLLPWADPEGKPCYLSTDDNGSVISRLADEIETGTTAARTPNRRPVP